MPGWDSGSWGYHGDDGKLFSESSRGKSYGPTYGKGDTVGCGIDFPKCELFFVKNGVRIGKFMIIKHLYQCTNCTGNIYIIIEGRFFPVVGIGEKNVKLAVEFDPTKTSYQWI
jgi:SPRY domain